MFWLLEYAHAKLCVGKVFALSVGNKVPAGASLSEGCIGTALLWSVLLWYYETGFEVIVYPARYSASFRRRRLSWRGKGCTASITWPPKFEHWLRAWWIARLKCVVSHCE